MHVEVQVAAVHFREQVRGHLRHPFRTLEPLASTPITMGKLLSLPLMPIFKSKHFPDASEAGEKLIQVETHLCPVTSSTISARIQGLDSDAQENSLRDTDTSATIHCSIAFLHQSL
jgi:hypothetical protein